MTVTLEMNDQKFDVNSLRVASPCSVGWESMTGDERTRHCQLCSLNVYNISFLTAAEVESMILKREGRLCIRMYRRADGTVLTKDCPVGLRAVQKRAATFAGAALAAILGLFSISFGQKHDNKPVDASKVKIVRTNKMGDGSELTGTLVDANGAVIPDVQIVLSIDNKELSATSKADGTYSIARLSSGNYSLKVDSPGFKEYKLKNLVIKEKERLELNIEMTVNTGEMVGDLIGVDPLIDTSSSTIQTTFTRRQIEDLPH